MRSRNGVIELTSNLGGLLSGSIENWALPGNVEEAVDVSMGSVHRIELSTYVLMVIFAVDAWKFLVVGVLKGLMRKEE